MNILEVEDIIKGLPDQALQKEAQAPTGNVPQFLVVSEIQRRTDMRKRFQSQQQEQPQGTISQQIVQEGIASLAPQPPQGMPQGMPPQGMPPQGMPPQGAPQGMPPQGMPMGQSLAQPMFRGGVVEMQSGRQATIGPFPEEEEDENPYPGVLLGGRNPMSIRQFDQDWEGETGTYTTPKGGKFVEYESPEYSFRAADRLLRNYGGTHGINTIRDVINRYAPPSDDNPTESYVDFISKRSGIDPDAEIDLSDPFTRSNILSPMAQFESQTTISPEGIRDSIASVDQNYAALMPERRIDPRSIGLEADVKAPADGFVEPDVQIEDPRLNIPFIDVGPEGGRRENEFAGTENLQALLDAVTNGKPFRKGQGKERQGTVARLPGKVTTAISNAIKSDADRTKRSDVDKESVEFVESFKSNIDPYSFVGDIIQEAQPKPKAQPPVPEVVYKETKKSEDPYAVLGDIIQEAQPRKTARSPESYMPDPLGQFDAERAAALVDSVGEGATRKDFMAGMTKPYMPDLLGQIEKEKKLYEKQYMPDPLGQFDAERAELLVDSVEKERSIPQAKTPPQPGMFVDMPNDISMIPEDYRAIVEAGFFQRHGYPMEDWRLMESYFNEDSRGRMSYRPPSEREIKFGQSQHSKKMAEDPLAQMEPKRTEKIIKEAEVKSAEDEARKEAEDVKPKTEEELIQDAIAKQSAGGSESGGMYDLMREIAGTKEEAKREAFANAMIQLGAGVASGDLAAGLSAAGKVASETMGNYRDRALKGKLAELQLKRTDEQTAYRNRQEALSRRREDRYSVTQANAALAKRIEEARFMVTTPALLEEKLGRKPSDKEIQDEINRQTNRIIDAVATQYGVERGLLGGMPFDIEEEEDSLTPEYQTDPSAPKLIDVN